MESESSLNPLGRAIYSNRWKGFWDEVNAGYDLNEPIEQSPPYRTPLTAAMTQNEKLARYIAQHPTFKPNYQDKKSKRTPLMEAITLKKKLVAQIIANRKDTDMKLKDADDRTAEDYLKTSGLDSTWLQQEEVDK